MNKLLDYKFIRFIYFYIVNKLYFKNLGFPNYMYDGVHIENKQLITIGKNNTFAHNCYISPLELNIKDNCWIGINSILIGKISMDSNIMIGPNVLITGANHDFSDINKPMKSAPLKVEGIYIEDDVWIGGNSTIVDGVTINKGAIIGAGSVVTRNVEEYTIVAGNPAKKLGERKNED